MTPNQVALLGVVIAGFFGLAGILTTAFGPTWVSWGKKPAFVETVVYKELERDVNLSEALEEQLMHITSYYTSRDLIFDFKQKVNDKIIIVATNTTSVKNVLDRRLSYQHKILFLEDTEIQSVTITAQNSHVTKFGIPELNAKRAVLPDGKVFSTIPIVIPPNEKVRIESGCESRMAVMSAAWFVEFRQRLPWLLHVD